MARLPRPGSDSGRWGEVLNDFLRVEMNEDGTLKKAGQLNGAIATLNTKYTKPSTGIPESDLAVAVQTKLNTVGGVADGSISTAKLQNAAVTTAKLETALQTKLAAITGTNSGDQDLSGLVSKATTVNGKALSTNIALSKSDIGLANVDNTADAAKPVSTAVQSALSAKADTLHSHAISQITDLQTTLDAKASVASVTAKYTKPSTGIPESDLAAAVQAKLGSSGSAGPISSNDITDATATGKSLVTATDAAAARTAIGAGTSTLVLGTTAGTAKAGDYVPTKADVGLTNVDNTSDANKPVSSATQTALNLKANTANVYDKTTADARYSLKTSTPATVQASTAGTFTLPDAELISLTLGASVTVVMPTFVEGKGILLYIRQDATGTRTITWPSTAEWPNLGSSPILNMNPNTVNTVAFVAAPGATKWQGYLVT